MPFADPDEPYGDEIRLFLSMLLTLTGSTAIEFFLMAMLGDDEHDVKKPGQICGQC